MKRGALAFVLACAGCSSQSHTSDTQSNTTSTSSARANASASASASDSARTVATVDSARVAPPPVRTSLTFVTNEAEARAEARDQHRPLVIEFFAEWCAACKEIRNKTFASADVQREGARFVALKLDVTDESAPASTEMMQKYKVTGLPTVLVFDSTGKEVARLTQFVNAQKFLETLAAVR
ncbi:MAG: thioredoxin domain-containing protein [Polyangiaceae bacterium]